MTNHLSPEERIDALDGTLQGARQAHAQTCARCQQDLASIRVTARELEAASAADVPEPSPLFWDHFQVRVGAAVDSVGPAPWWRGSSRAWIALATAAAVLFAVWISPLRPRDAATTALPEVEVAMIADTVQWEFMTNVLGTLEDDAAHAVLAPTAVAVDAAFESLTASERETFARLLQAEMTEGSD